MAERRDGSWVDTDMLKDTNWTRASEEKESDKQTDNNTQPKMAPCSHCNGKRLNRHWLYCPMCGSSLPELPPLGSV